MYTPWLGNDKSKRQARCKVSMWYAWFSVIATSEEKGILKTVDTAHKEDRKEVKARLVRLLIGIVAHRWQDAGKTLVPQLQWEEKGHLFDWKSHVSTLSLSFLESKLHGMSTDPPTQEVIEKVRAHMIFKKALSQSSGGSPTKKRKISGEGGMPV